MSKPKKLIVICTATSLAALLFDGTVTAHLLFGYPVEDEKDVDDLNPTQCEIKQNKKDFCMRCQLYFLMSSFPTSAL
jgi:hypothetical protein